MGKLIDFKRFSQHFAVLCIVLVTGVLCVNLVSANVIDGSYAYYDFDEVLGTTTAFDSSNNNYDFTVGNSTGWVAGKINLSYSGNNTDRINTTIRDDLHNTNLKNMTINFWYRRTGDWNGSRVVISKAETPVNGDYSIGPQANNNIMNVQLRDDVGLKQVTSTTPFPLNTWVMVTMIINETHGSIYINGVREDTDALTDYTINNVEPTLLHTKGSGNNAVNNFSIDELGWWNRGLNETEIAELYNSGDAFNPYIISTTLNSPTDNFVTLNRTNLFNCSASQESNMTLYIDGIANETINKTSLFERTLTLSFASHLWACGMENENGTFLSQNFTINTTRFIENSQTFNEKTTEGGTETFSINLTLSESIQISTVRFIYNDVESFSPFVVTGNEMIAQKTLAVPTVSLNTNFTFFWNMTLDVLIVKFWDKKVPFSFSIPQAHR